MTDKVINIVPREHFVREDIEAMFGQVAEYLAGKVGTTGTTVDELRPTSAIVILCNGQNAQLEFFAPRGISPIELVGALEMVKLQIAVIDAG